MSERKICTNPLVLPARLCGAAAGNRSHRYIGKVCSLLLVRADYIGRAPGRGPEGTGNCSSCYCGRVRTRVSRMTARSKLRGQKKEAASSFGPFAPVKSFLVAKVSVGERGHRSGSHVATACPRQGSNPTVPSFDNHDSSGTDSQVNGDEFQVVPVIRMRSARPDSGPPAE